MRKLFKLFRSEESGATAIEYALIAALIGTAVIAAAQSLGDQISASFQDIETSLSDATGGDANDDSSDDDG